jgi:hypothetical protein
MPHFDLTTIDLRIRLEAIEPIHLPAFAGSKLEGSFGHALYNIACTRKDLEACQPCPLRQICPFAALYMPSLPSHLNVASLENPPRPLVFHTEFQSQRTIQTGTPFEFGLRIFGKAKQHLPYIIAAIGEMGRSGIGNNRGRFELLQVQSIQPYTLESRVIVTADNPVVQLEPIVLSSTDFPRIPKNQMTLKLETFMHLKTAGQVVETLQFQILIRALQRRLSNLEQIYGAGSSVGENFSELPQLARGVEILEQDTEFVSQRRTGHGRQAVVMNGLIGSVTYTGDLEPFAQALRYGELIGVGKWAHFGAGRYKIEEETHDSR